LFGGEGHKKHREKRRGAFVRLWFFMIVALCTGHAKSLSGVLKK
jgi:hypothetical protein